MDTNRAWNVGDLCTWCDAKGWTMVGLCRGCGKKTCNRHHIEIKGRIFCAPPEAWGCAHDRSKQVRP